MVTNNNTESTPGKRILVLSILLEWHTRQIDFILAHPQAPLETALFMEIPKGVFDARIAW